MKRVLLTGATGFIGRNCIAPLLAKNYEVHVVSSKLQTNEGTASTELYWHQADLLDAAAVTTLMQLIAPTHLLHLAWYAVPGSYWTSLENVRWVQAGLQLVQEFSKQGGQRVVMAGTCAEYDWQYGYCSEGITSCVPTTLYGTSKHALRLMLEAYAVQTNLSAAWGRIFFLYGQHEHPARLVASVIRALLRGEAAHCSHGNQIRDFLNVEDLGEAFVALLESQVQGAVNLASGQAVTIKQIVYKIGEQLGRSDLIQMGVIPSPANEPPLLIADVRRLNQEVGWFPKYDLNDGLTQTINWWSNQFQNKQNQN